jgi:hypothetical protein
MSRMQARSVWLGSLVVLVLSVGCAGTSSEINPFITLTDALGVTSTGTTDETGSGQGLLAQAPFRREMTVTFKNNHPDAELRTSLVAWVSPSSLRSAQQQDALFADGYVQLSSEVRLGTAFTLPVGTFVYNGGGTAGAKSIVLTPAQTTTAAQGGAQTTTPTTQAYTFITPDAVVVLLEPPVSCDSVAFAYTVNGQPLTSVGVAGAVGPYSGATGQGGFKTLAQVNVYQCEPLKPGLFIRLSGARQPDEFLEGDNITFDFNQNPDANGNFGIVTIASP